MPDWCVVPACNLEFEVARYLDFPYLQAGQQLPQKVCMS